MRRRKWPRAGKLSAEALVGLLLLVLVVGLGSCSRSQDTPNSQPGSSGADLAAINERLRVLDSTVMALNLKGDTLRKWLAATDGPELNASGGLTSWLIAIKTKLNQHMDQTIAGGAHSGAHHQHLDPPPPPPW